MNRKGAADLLDRLTEPASRAASFGRGLTLGAILVLLAGGIVLAGTPARQPALAASLPDQDISVQIDASTLPDVTVDPSVERVNMVVDDAAAMELAVTLAENLALEGEAIRYADASRLAGADSGRRLDEIQARLEDAVTEGVRPVDHYEFESLHLRVAGESEGQTSAALAFEATGTVERVVHDPSGAELSHSSRPFSATFVMRQVGSERWSIVRVIES